MPESKSLIVTILLVMLTAMGPVTTDLYLPSLPSLTTDLSTNVATAQLTLSVFMIGFALSQIIYGPLSDRFGRRPVVIIGFSLYTLASIACAFAWNIETLIIARFFQAVGGCSGVVIARAAVRDIYGPRESARVLALLGAAMGLAPAISPVIGGFIHKFYGWTGNFMALTLYGAVTVIMAFLIFAETNRHKDPTALNPRAMARNFAALATARRFVGYSLTNTFIFASLFTFISGSSFVYIDVYDIPPEDFWIYFSACPLGYVLGSLTSARLSRRVGPDSLILAGVLFGTVTSLIGMAAMGLGADGPVTITLSVIGVFVAVGMVMPNSIASAIAPYPKMAGAASSLLGLVQMTVGATAGIIVGITFDGTAWPMMFLLSLMNISGLTAYLLLIRARGLSQMQDVPKDDPADPVPPAP
ncbi:Bcr/CflA family efflux MFS transporter [Alphaproteobacteria bacterium HT1-32]|nr:Bcr/CflA family efflux MFS transporter [Alphaproteobacteria bacterium HT1-32]